MIKDPLLNHFKKLVNAHLDELEDKEATEKEDIKKSILEAESMQKSGYPVGTIREWKGKKYIKIAPGKWRPKYDSNSRGAKMSIAALKRKADKCTSSEELLQLILENRERFSDDNGRPLPFVKELSDYVSGKNDALESGKKAKKAPKAKKSKKTVVQAKADADQKEIDYRAEQAKIRKEVAFEKEIERLMNSGVMSDTVEGAIKDLERHIEWINSGIPKDETDYEKAKREGETEATQSIIDKLKAGIKEIIAKFVKSPEKQEEKELEEKYGAEPETTIKDIRDKYEASKSVTGNKKTVTLPDGTKIKCHYKIVEADAPTASHDEKTFAPSKGFPTTKDGKSVNDRDYQNDADAGKCKKNCK